MQKLTYADIQAEKNSDAIFDALTESERESLATRGAHYGHSSNPNVRACLERRARAWNCCRLTKAGS